VSGSFTFPSESVSEGHPDTVCNDIPDSIPEAPLEQDLHATVHRQGYTKERMPLGARDVILARRGWDGVLAQTHQSKEVA